MNTLEAEKIKLDKQKEAEQLFEQLGIKKNSKASPSEFTMNKFITNSNENKKTKFHWTRLSINSNITHTID